MWFIGCQRYLGHQYTVSYFQCSPKKSFLVWKKNWQYLFFFITNEGRWSWLFFQFTRENFCDFMFGSAHGKGCTLPGKNLLPRKQVLSFQSILLWKRKAEFSFFHWHSCLICKSSVPIPLRQLHVLPLNRCAYIVNSLYTDISYNLNGTIP